MRDKGKQRNGAAVKDHRKKKTRNVIKMREGVERGDRGVRKKRLFDRKWDQKHKTGGVDPVRVQQKIN